MSNDQKKQITFLHHALWVFAKGLAQEDAVLVAQISEFRNAIERHAEQGHDRYCRDVTKGGVLLLQSVV